MKRAYKELSLKYIVGGLLICLIHSAAFSQEVEGVIRAEEGNGIMPLPGVTVQVKGENTGAISDFDGKFVIVLPNMKQDTLIFRYLGYTDMEVPVNGRSYIEVQMLEDVNALDEIVLIGYGQKKKRNITGAISSIDSKVLESRPITNISSAIQGAVPGLVVQRGSGQPGSENFTFNVRGISSINGNNAPLVLIDGIPGDVNLLNPVDIENVTVLKDGAASIYGSRAANGVILITTKQGKSGKTVINYSYNTAISKLAGMMETPNHYQMAIMDNEANIHNGAAPMYTEEMLDKLIAGNPNPIPHPIYGGWMLFFTSTDWREAVFENGLQQKHALSISGGGERSKYFLSGSYVDQGGVIKYANDNNKRYNLRMNYDYQLADFMKLESKLSIQNQVRSDVGGAGSSGVMYETIFGMPNHPIYTQSGLNYFAQGGWGNAVAIAKEAATATFKTRKLNTNFNLITDLSDDLKLYLQAGINYTTDHNKDIGESYPLYNWDDSSIAYYSIANPDRNYLYHYQSENTYRNFTGYFDYNNTFNDKHTVAGMIGAAQEENDFEWIDAGRNNFITQDVWSLNLGSTDNMTNDGGGTHWAIRSLFGRFSYSFDNRYIVEANMRYDGSSRFQADSRWGFFPGVTAGWVLSNEGFLRNTKAIDLLKLRFSYGETGNQDGIDLYDYYQLISVGRDSPYPFGDGRQDQSAYLSGIVSLNRTWETVATSNVGIDANLLNSKLNLSFDYFIKRNHDMLIPVKYPSVLGGTPPFTNAGELKTKGFEATIGWKDAIGSLDYSLGMNLSDAKNVVLDYGGTDTYTLGLNQIREGYPINTYFAYQFDGLIRNEAELNDYRELEGVPNDIGIGDARFKDLNGDGVISTMSDEDGGNGDLINVGNTTPRYTYGINLDLKYKNFDMGVFLQGVGKRTLFRVGEYATPWSDWWRQPPLFYYGKTWSAERPNAIYPKLTHGSIRHWNYQPSTLQAVNAAYLRLKNLQFGFTFPNEVTDKIGLDKARIYFSGFDLWEIHHVKGGWDPESSTTGFNYPFQRLYSLGLDITL